MRRLGLRTEQPEVAASDSACVVAEGNSREIVANLRERVDAGWTGQHKPTEETLLSTTRRYGSGSNGRQPIGLNPSDRKVVRVRIPSRAPCSVAETAPTPKGAIWYASVPGQRCTRVAEGGEVLDTVTADRGCFACMLGGENGRSLYIVANNYTGGGASDGVVLIQSVAVPRAGRP